MEDGDESDLLQNAIDSVQLGIEDFKNDDPKRILSAFRNLHAGVLLLCKEVLLRLCPKDSKEVHIKAKQQAIKDSDGNIIFVGVGDNTVTEHQIIDRFKSLGIKTDLSKLNALTKIRNDIEHYYSQNLSEIQPRRGGAKLFKNLKRVIIDEISMVRADLLDAVDHALQINRKDARPFGGVQIILVGDFLQLPPVVRGDEEEILSSMGYETPFAFSAKCLQKNKVVTIELSKVHRQDDPEYIRLLGNIRSGDDLEETVKAFNNTCFGQHKRDAAPVILTGTNAIAEKYNQRGLKSLPSQDVLYEGIISGEFNLDKDKLPTPELLNLKVGARIMMVKNDKGKKWVNGSLGEVVRLGQDRIWVKLDDKDGEHEVAKAAWENIRYEWDDEKQSIEAKVVGSYSQIPVIPAWALTIHKAQGLTLENVRVDLATGAFASGQAYVALSRARSLEGLSFATPLRVTDAIVDRRLIQSEHSFKQID